MLLGWGRRNNKDCQLLTLSIAGNPCSSEYCRSGPGMCHSACLFSLMTMFPSLSFMTAPSFLTSMVAALSRA